MGYIIAIDGPAASGKSTTAREVARRLGYLYIDTGAMYRAVTLAVHRQGVDPRSEPDVTAIAADLPISFLRDDEQRLRTMIASEDVSEEIRSPHVAADVSLVSSYRGVRSALVSMQRALGSSGGIVMDGRDIGTTVFPNADLKIFLIADLDARARRRGLEQSRDRDGVSALAAELAERDRKDSSRMESPLRKADDAVEIDTSCLTIDEQVDRVLAMVDLIEPRTEKPAPDNRSTNEGHDNV